MHQYKKWNTYMHHVARRVQFVAWMQLMDEIGRRIRHNLAQCPKVLSTFHATHIHG